MREQEDVEVASVWDHDAERAARFARELGAPVAADVDAVWGNPELDGVVICSETDRHAGLVMAAAAARKNMFVEKPLGMNAADSWAMAEAVLKAGVVFQTGYFMRSSPVHLFLRDQIAAGAFGRITRARHSNCHSGSLGHWFDTDFRWMADPAVAGCGAFGDLGTHSLDILLWLFGDVERVTGYVDVAVDNYDGCDEFGEALLLFRNGVLATLAAGWVDVANPISLLISGTEGHAHVCEGQLYFKSNHVEGATGDEPWTDLPEPLPHAFQLYLDTLNGVDDLPLVTVREAAMRSAVMDAVYAGAADRAWVSPVVR
jgi:predicted dehydrogenase